MSFEHRSFGGLGFGGGFGQPFFNPFFNPFLFPRRRFFPFFFLSPFFFPFFRGEDDRDGTYFAQHQCKDGDTMGTLAQTYNVPQPILEVMNPHLQNPEVLEPGSIAYIPRMDKMYCHKMYMEQEVSETGANSPMHPTQQMMPNTGMPHSMYPTQQMMPNTGTPHPMYPTQQMMPNTGTPHPMYPGQQMMPSSGTPYSMYPGQQMTPYPYTGTQQ